MGEGWGFVAPGANNQALTSSPERKSTMIQLLSVLSCFSRGLVTSQIIEKQHCKDTTRNPHRGKCQRPIHKNEAQRRFSETV